MAKKAAPSAPSKKIEKKEPAKKAPKNAPAKQKEVKKVDSKKIEVKKTEVKKTEAKKTAPKVEKKSPEKAVAKSKEPLKLLSAAGKISTPEKIDKKAGTKTDNKADNKIDNKVDKKQASKATDLVITVVDAAPSDDDGDVASEKSAVPAKKAKLSKSAEAKEKAARQASSDEEARWSDLYEKYKSEKPIVYDMRKQFDANRPLEHKVLGWGWILSNENDRLEVLFKEGRKILISNYVTK